MLYLFLFVNILILIKTFFLESEINKLEKVKKLIKGLSVGNVNERYVSSKLTKLVLESKSALVISQLLSLALFIVLLVEYGYAFVYMFLVPFYPIIYIVMCLLFFANTADSHSGLSNERVLLVCKILWSF
jgi:hypothetical protein